MEKQQKKSTWGGWREGAGRRATGHTKTVVSVSVDPKIWRRSLAKWKGKASRLVEALLREYAASRLAIGAKQ
jgi:hypothetical protein